MTAQKVSRNAPGASTPPRRRALALAAGAALAVAACEPVWNNPHPPEARGNVLRTAFSEQPKYLDPARSYSSNEYTFIGLVYEPVLQYHYLRRPYQLEPLTAAAMPTVTHFDEAGRPTGDPAQAARTTYEVTLRPGVRYQPHPAFARGPDGRHLYHALPPDAGYARLADFPQRGSRELRAADYVYQIKRLADPELHCPIAGLLSKHIVGFAEFRNALVAGGEPDALEMEGVEALGPLRFSITTHKYYPQFIYWLAMPFFAPMPPEAVAFYDQPQLRARNVSLNWFPVGTGPYMLSENNPNRRMLLERNPHYRGRPYPTDGAPGDAAAGLLADAGRMTPFIDRIVFSLEREGIPYWNKFLQGYYDSSGVSSDSFDQAVQLTSTGEFEVSDAMRARDIRLAAAVNTSTFYFGFNMRDPVVGGFSQRAVKLRRALSIAVDIEEYIAIFLNGRGVASQGPIPPGIFGHRAGEAGMNPYVYEWRDGRPRRRSLAAARALLAEAGYPEGVERGTGKPLTLHFDTVGTGPDAKAFLSWMRKQFAKLGVQLAVRNTDYNRFQEKMRRGDAQIFRWGWNADYPDPENFLFLLYGPNARADDGGGQNATNYHSPEFDRLFERMESMPDGPERGALIDEMVEILRHDAPWIWGNHPESFSLRHAWLRNVKPNLMAHNAPAYYRLDPQARAGQVRAWNAPEAGPLVFAALALVLFLVPAWRVYLRRQRRGAL